MSHDSKRPHRLTPGMPARCERLRFMSADAGAAGTPGAGGAGGDRAEKGGYNPPATQAALDAIIGERVARERGKFGDYDDLKAKAARLAEIEDANKSEAQKAADRITAAEAEVASVPAKVADGLREALVSLGVVTEDRKVLLTATDPTALLEQVKAIQSMESDRRKKTGGRDVLAGRTPSTPAGTDAKREWLRSLTDQE